MLAKKLNKHLDQKKKELTEHVSPVVTSPSASPTNKKAKMVDNPNPATLMEKFRESIDRKVKAQQKMRQLLAGNLSDRMPKFLIYSRLDKQMLKCMLLRFTEIDDQIIPEVKKLLLENLNLGDIMELEHLSCNDSEGHDETLITDPNCETISQENN